MEKGGLVKRHIRINESGQTSNGYSFEGLIDAATEFAKEELQARAKSAKESKEKVKRMKPKI